MKFQNLKIIDRSDRFERIIYIFTIIANCYNKMN